MCNNLYLKLLFIPFLFFIQCANVENGNFIFMPKVSTAPGVDFNNSTFCYPNPATGAVADIQIYVTSQATFNMVISDNLNKPILSESGTLAAQSKFVYRWDISNIKMGIYPVHIDVEYSNSRTDKKDILVAVNHP
jgi:hypothetical protein